MARLIFLGLMTTLFCNLSSWQAPLAQAQRLAPDHHVAYAQGLVQRRPTDAQSYYLLGDAYIQKARHTGDAATYAAAEQALRKALEFAPQFAPALRHLAYTFHARHAFREAAAAAAQAIALEPQDSHTYGILGDAYVELGSYAQAQDAYTQMLQLREDLYALSRLAGLKSLQGRPYEAIADLERAVRYGQAHRLPPESLAWVQWQLGNEHLALGRLATAEGCYQDALERVPGYYRARAGLAQVRIAQGRYAEGIQLSQQVMTALPSLEYAAALGDAYVKMGRPEEAQKHYALVEHIGRLQMATQGMYQRELALFYADHEQHLDTALTLATNELAIRQDIYAYDVLAWCLYKRGRLHDAQEAMQQALALGTQDARLWFHAGMIAAGLGDTALAQAHLQRALARNPYFHPLHAAQAAQTLVALSSTRSHESEAAM